MFRIVLLVIGCWLLYKLIFDLIIPIYRSTKVMRSKFKEMHQEMQDQMNQQSSTDQFSNNPPFQKEKTNPSKGDYIEFEEVKE
jgi:hypothetical protein